MKVTITHNEVTHTTEYEIATYTYMQLFTKLIHSVASIYRYKVVTIICANRVCM